MKHNYIDVNGRKIKLLYTVYAMNKLGEISGKSNTLEWFQNDDKADEMGLFRKICIAIEVLANAAIIADNCSIELGLSNGEKQKQFPEGIFASILSPVDAAEYFKIVMNTIVKGSSFTVPDKLKIDVDEDYLAIESEKKSD